ncbi:MAG TPA: hypothetical protein PKC18_06075 [Lacipirellulaceae bacterium]|nr:hypothetical protein [Lacipirellulaceae bacterium]
MLAVLICRQYQLARSIDAICVPLNETLSHRLCKTGCLRHPPAHDRFAADFVHILPTGTCTSRKGDVQFSGWNHNIAIDNEWARHERRRSDAD